MAGIQIPIEVVDKFSKQLDSLNKGMDKLSDGAKKQNTQFNILAADVVVRYGREAAGAVIRFGRESLKAFADAEKAASRLDHAVKNQGITSKGYTEALLAQATALQAVSIHSDEAIVETQTLLTTFGLAGEELNKTTKATIDLASGLGIDLRSATLLMGKAFAGETSALSRYGLKIDETAKGADKFAAVMTQVNQRFGGAAQAEATTYAGRVAVLTNRFDDLKEKIGKELVPVAEAWTRWLSQGLTWVEKQVQADDNLTKSKDKVQISMRLNIENMKREMAGLTGVGDLASDNGRRYQQLAKDIDIASKAYADRARIIASLPASPEEPAPKSKGGAKTDNAAALKLHEEQLLLDESANQKYLSATMSHQELADLQDQFDAAEVERQFGKDAADDVRRAQELSKEKILNQAKAQAHMSLLNTIGTLASAKNKELAAIGKAAAMAMATINTFQGITLAMATVPFPLNFVVAGLVGVAGAAQVANIAGVQMAEGGLVTARPGGMRATIGEGGRDEAVIPLDDPRTARRLRGALGGSGGVNVNVGGINIRMNGNSGGRGLARELAEEIRSETVDAITLALRMSNLSNLNQGLAA